MDFISQGVETLFCKLSVYDRPEGVVYVPDMALKNVDTRIGSCDTLHSWFRRCADAVGGPEQCCIEDNIAAFGVMKWRNGHMTYVNLQAIVADEGALDDFYCDEASARCQYTRLELDFDKPGPLFKEPQPHIHTLPDGAPRFGCSPWGERVTVARFIEFLYLNFAHEKWLTWARNVWRERTALPEDQDPFDVMVDAYKGGQSQVLVDHYSDHIARLRQLLAAESEHRARAFAPLSPSAALLTYR